MTREGLEALINETLDAETRTTPPPAGEEGDWLYGSAGFHRPRRAWLDGTAPFGACLDASGAGVLAYGRAGGGACG